MKNYKAKKIIWSSIALILAAAIIAVTLSYFLNTDFKKKINNLFNQNTEQQTTQTPTTDAKTDAKYDELANSIYELGEKLNSAEVKIEACQDAAIMSAQTKKDFEALRVDYQNLKEDYTNSKTETNPELAGIRTRISTLENSLNSINSTLDVLTANIYHENLLINGDFRVNQRKQTSYSTANEYGVDRWRLGANLTVTPIDNGINFKTTGAGAFCQFVEDYYYNQLLTLSIKVDNVIYYSTCRLDNSKPTADKNYINYQIEGFGYLKLDFNASASRKCLQIYVYYDTPGEFVIEYIKLEVGSLATANYSRPYAEELAMCQRYYQRLSGMFVSYQNSNTEARILLRYNVMRISPKANVLYGGSLSKADGSSVTYTARDISETYDQFAVIKYTFSNTNASYFRTNIGISLDAEIY